MKKILSRSSLHWVIGASLFFWVSCFPNGSKENLLHVYLTWQSEDTSSTMTVNFHKTVKNFDSPNVYYDIAPRGGNPSAYAYKIKAEHRAIPGLERKFYRAELKGLSPTETYYFIVGDKKTGYSDEKKFKTLPNDGSSVKFVQGGDMGIDPGPLVPLLKLAGEQDPDLAIIGGDIAYENGNYKKLSSWDEWLKMYTQNMVTSDGRLIPMLVAIGNHEVMPVLFTSFYKYVFAQGGDSYFKRKIGNDKVIYTLDSSHLALHGPWQSQWLDKEMKKDKNVATKIAIYHVPMYPSVRGYNAILSTLGRKFWLPIFDKHHLTVAFENHEHAFKRTKPLRKGKVVSEGGTIYFGDGAWGRSPRSTTMKWYLEKAEGIRHFWVGEVGPDEHRYVALASDGSALDEVVMPAPKVQPEDNSAPYVEPNTEHLNTEEAIREALAKEPPDPHSQDLD